MNSRDMIMKMIGISRGKGLTQAQLSRQSGYSYNGQTITRMVNKGDCRVSTLINILDSMGYELQIKEKLHE